MKGSPNTDLRVAVLVNDEYIKKWQRNALAPLVAEGDVEVTHVVVNKQISESDDGWMAFAVSAFERFRSYPLWSLVGIARLLTPDPDHDRPVHINTIDGIENAERIKCSPQRIDEYWETLPAEVIDSLETVDVVIRFGFGMLTGRILSAPKYGVLSYHPGDIREYRGQPGGLWEFLNGEDQMGVTVQRINETLDGGDIAALASFDISDANTWQEIQRQAYREAEGMLLPAVRKLVDADTSLRPPETPGELYTFPQGRDVLRYLAKNTRGRLRNALAHRPPLPAPGREQGTLAVLLLFGPLIALLHPLLTHHYVVPIHFELIIGFVLFAIGFVLFTGDDRRQFG